MGYYYTFNPRNRMPADSLASPKTHTPLSRLEERGLRCYSANLSRWISRDPAGKFATENIYNFLKEEPINRIDLLGLWDKLVHHMYTRSWAVAQTYSDQSSEGIGQKNEDVDALLRRRGPFPVVGDQSYHFNTAATGALDSRIKHSRDDLKAAKDACDWNRRKDDYREAVKLMGFSLHAIQDIIAHGDFNCGGSTFYVHNSLGPSSPDAHAGFPSPGDYPDDPALDVKGSPDGIAEASFIDANGHAIFVQGGKRLRKTRDVSFPILKEFIDHVKANSRALPCGECRKYFLTEDLP